MTTNWLESDAVLVILSLMTLYKERLTDNDINCSEKGDDVVHDVMLLSVKLMMVIYSTDWHPSSAKTILII